MNDEQIENSSELVSVVMPMYCEGDHIAAMLDNVADVLAEISVPFEFILIDDGSPDDTWKVLNEQAKKFSGLRAARLTRNFGKELAICAGLEMARGEAVIVLDSDGQHPPALLPEMIRLWRENKVDIVEATKSRRGKETYLDKTSAGLFYFIWSKLSGFELRGASDFKLLSRRAVDAYLQLDERNVFFRGMTAWIGFKRVQVPFEVPDRVGGKSGWSKVRLVRLALTAITAFSALPLHAVTILGILFMIFSLLFGAQTLYVILRGNAVNGFATVIFLLLIVGSVLMISLGTIGEYIARIYEEVKRRPRYLIGQLIEPSVYGSKPEIAGKENTASKT